MLAAAAYGLVCHGQQFPDRFITGPPDWPTWWIKVALAHERFPERWSDSAALIHMRPYGFAVVDRLASTTTLHLPSAPDPEAFAHPLLGMTALAVAAWLGRSTFHAGAVVIDGRAWLVAGERAAGKSSTLYWFAAHGFDVVTDDLSVIDNGRVLAGPRCLDLRQSAADHFGAGVDVGVLGTRRRWRVPLGPVAASVPVAGWVRPSWAVTTAVTHIPITERLRFMAATRGMRTGDPAHVNVMPLLAMPAYDFARPRRFEELDDAMSTLLEVLQSRG